MICEKCGKEFDIITFGSGRVKLILKQKSNCIMLDKYYPTTKLCTNCGSYLDDIKQNDRTFICPICGHTEDRDIYAAKNMIWLYNNIVATGHSEVKHVELQSVISNILRLSKHEDYSL